MQLFWISQDYEKYSYWYISFVAYDLSKADDSTYRHRGIHWPHEWEVYTHSYFAVVMRSVRRYICKVCNIIVFYAYLRGYIFSGTLGGNLSWDYKLQVFGSRHDGRGLVEKIFNFQSAFSIWSTHLFDISRDFPSEWGPFYIEQWKWLLVCAISFVYVKLGASASMWYSHFPDIMVFLRRHNLCIAYLHYFRQAVQCVVFSIIQFQYMHCYSGVQYRV